MAESWVPVIDMTRDEGRTRTATVELIETLIRDIPQFILDRVRFVWINDTIDRRALDYLQERYRTALPVEDIYGAVIADEQGRYLELYWNTIASPRPSAWWRRHDVAEPRHLELSERVKLVLYDLLLGLLREALNDTRADLPEGQEDTDELLADNEGTAGISPEETEQEQPLLPVFDPHRHRNRLAGYCQPVNRIIRYLN